MALGKLWYFLGMLALSLLFLSSCKKHDGAGAEPGLRGELDVRLTDTETGALRCAVEVELRGTPYTGASICRDCDFQFRMDTSVVTEDGPACEDMYRDYYSTALQPYPFGTEPDTVFIGFADIYHLHGGDYTIEDVLLIGHDFGGPEPHLLPGFWDREGYLTSVSYADGELEWTHHSDGADGATGQIDGLATIAL